MGGGGGLMGSSGSGALGPSEPFRPKASCQSVLSMEVSPLLPGSLPMSESPLSEPKAGSAAGKEGRTGLCLMGGRGRWWGVCLAGGGPGGGGGVGEAAVGAARLHLILLAQAQRLGP